MGPLVLLKQIGEDYGILKVIIPFIRTHQQELLVDETELSLWQIGNELLSIQK